MFTNTSIEKESFFQPYHDIATHFYIIYQATFIHVFYGLIASIYCKSFDSVVSPHLKQLSTIIS